jgi:hypothetical protein
VRRAAFLAVLALAGCNPHLFAASVPPPGAVGRLHTKYRWSELTEGTVLAFTCVKYGSPCQRASAHSDDATIADVLPAALASLEAAPMGGVGNTPTSEFVIVGKKPGITYIHVQATQGHVDLKVTVLPANTP